MNFSKKWNNTFIVRTNFRRSQRFCVYSGLRSVTRSDGMRHRSFILLCLIYTSRFLPTTTNKPEVRDSKTFCFGTRAVHQRYYSRLPITRTFKRNQKISNVRTFLNICRVQDLEAIRCAGCSTKL